ncbi:MAG: hypothetical protein M1321_00375 [Candidatus Marsarchaeota archaeon]|nr:hypothetical protein [Candidatus Marsarchaeota archaeon]
METEEMALVTARKLGGSIVVSIPKSIVEHEGIVPGESIRIIVKKARKSWFGAFKGAGHMTREDELDEQIRD